MMKQALELDPLSLAINRGMGGMYYRARQYDQAIEQWRRTLEIDPDFPDVHHTLGKAYEQKGMYQEALAEFQKAVTLSRGSPRYLGGLGHGYAISGNLGEARNIVAKLKELSKKRYVSPYDVAIIFVGLGQNDQAIEWLEKAADVRSQDVFSLNGEPIFDPLRSDARFTALLKKVGLEK